MTNLLPGRAPVYAGFSAADDRFLSFQLQLRHVVSNHR